MTEEARQRSDRWIRELDDETSIPSELDAACIDGYCGCRPGECLAAGGATEEHRTRELEAEARLNGGLSPLGMALVEADTAPAVHIPLSGATEQDGVAVCAQLGAHTATFKSLVKRDLDVLLENTPMDGRAVRLAKAMKAFFDSINEAVDDLAGAIDAATEGE
jgi:hypothetical protein